MVSHRSNAIVEKQTLRTLNIVYIVAFAVIVIYVSIVNVVVVHVAVIVNVVDKFVLHHTRSDRALYLLGTDKRVTS